MNAYDTEHRLSLLEQRLSLVEQFGTNQAHHALVLSNDDRRLNDHADRINRLEAVWNEHDARLSVLETALRYWPVADIDSGV